MVLKVLIPKEDEKLPAAVTTAKEEAASRIGGTLREQGEE